jgi:hypothetical protein
MKHSKSMNAYEIRLEILQTAMASASDKWYAEKEVLSEEWHNKRCACGDDAATVAAIGAPKLPTWDREVEAIRIAKKLYAFVEGE